MYPRSKRMRARRDVCKTVFIIKDGVIPPGSKFKYTCKKCKPTNCVARAVRSSDNKAPPARVGDRPVNNLRDDHGENRAAFLKDKILSGIKDLPPMPQLVMEIHSQLSGENINTKKIADAIQIDPAIASKVLRLANSAYYGMSGRISNIQSALTLMGLRGLLETVAMAGSQELLTGKLPGYGYEAEDLWRHSLAVAYGCKILAHSKDPGIHFHFRLF